ncbi:hypothetical protein SAMN04489712_104135 [Thermomonospora echinospora]|uniref:Uncharacterized protein n=1 Tax=Thermomonospora echinospora TaxID=1992 RepID=A0A1H5YS29_9ACTN|nr:hypothetical protein [Thermomonospora echinospora]SEG26452.1 hypothetical protein SAMN04489712_104135 [Thermomonospora echinospora]
MEPDQIAAALERAHPGWAVIPGYYTGWFTAIPGPSYPYLDSGMITAIDPTELQRRMALVEASGKNTTGQARPAPVPPAPPPPSNPPKSGREQPPDQPRSHPAHGDGPHPPRGGPPRPSTRW